MAGINATRQTCLVDADCPGATVCYVSGLSWTKGVSRCDCMGKYGRFGAACDEPTAYFYISVCSTLLTALVALYVAALCVRDLRLVSKHLGGATASASNATAGFTASALFSLTAWKLSYLLEFIVPISDELVVITIAQGTKETRITEITGVMLVFLVTTATLCLLNLSLMWLEVSRTAFKVSNTMRRKMNVYRTACIVVGSSVTVVNAVLVVRQQAFLAVLVVVPLSLVMCALFIAGRRSMERMLDKARGTLGDSQPAMADRVESTSRSIRRCCNRTVFWMLAFVGSTALWFLVMILAPHSGWKEFTRIGVGCWPQILYEVGPWCLFAALHTQYVYCHESIVARLCSRAERTVTSMQAPPSTDMKRTEFVTLVRPSSAINY